jgi:delta1-piperideine-2-carboxylate reductase
MPQTVSVGELTGLVVRVFLGHGVSAENAGPVAETVVAAERDGAVAAAGLCLDAESGWVDGRADPVVADAAPGLVATEAANGFAQPALRASAPVLREKVRRQGIAAVAIRNSHHFAAVWPDIEPFTVEGFIAFAIVNGRQRMVVWGGKRKLLGTSPMAFACPRPRPTTVVWDQASSVMAQGEVLLAARRGKMLPAGVGLDADGRQTTDPRAVLDGGSILPFGGHKGSSIAFMIEILAGALTGGPFGFEDCSPEYPGAQTSKAGQTVILIDPLLVSGNSNGSRACSMRSPRAVSNACPRSADMRGASSRCAPAFSPVSNRDWTTLQELPPDLYRRRLSLLAQTGSLPAGFGLPLGPALCLPQRAARDGVTLQPIVAKGA